MGETKSAWGKLAVRTAIAAPLLLFGAAVFASGALAAIPFGVAALVVGAMIMAPAVGGVCALPIASLFCPDRHYDRVPPRYSVAESKASKGCFEEGLEEYEKVLAEHPQEFRAYSAMLDIAALHLQDEARAEQIYTRGLAAVTTDGERQALSRQYEDAIEALQRAEPRRQVLQARSQDDDPPL